MYRAYGNITCDFCGTEVSSMDFIVVKSKEAVEHYCNKDCKNSSPRSDNMDEVERNKRLFMLLNRLVGDKDLKSIELIRTWIDTDTPAMKHSFKMVEESGNFNFKEDEKN
jgi:hypothetical protein